METRHIAAVGVCAVGLAWLCRRSMLALKIQPWRRLLSSFFWGGTDSPSAEDELQATIEDWLLRNNQGAGGSGEELESHLQKIILALFSAVELVSPDRPGAPPWYVHDRCNRRVFR